MKTRNFLTMVALVMGMAMTCVMTTSCSKEDNPVDIPGDIPGDGSGAPYEIRYSRNDAKVGDYYFANGLFSNAPIISMYGAPLQAIGIVVYKGHDEFTENGVTLRDGTILQSQGLVMALSNAGGDIEMEWGEEIPVYVPEHQADSKLLEFDEADLVSSTERLKDTKHVGGYDHTKLLVEKAIKMDKPKYYAAAEAAWNYQAPVPDGTTGWFLPSAQQWVKILTGLGGFSNDDFKYGTRQWFPQGFVERMNNMTMVVEDASPMSGYHRFWTSTEQAVGSAIVVEIDSQDDYQRDGFYFNEGGKTWKRLVRPVLAF